jgi:hypothetical protein
MEALACVLVDDDVAGDLEFVVDLHGALVLHHYFHFNVGGC